MGLIKCKECGKEISKSAKQCPQCGHKNKPGVVKQIFSGFVGFLVIVMIIGAFTDSDEEAGAESTAQEYAVDLPSSEQSFVAAVQQAQQGAEEAANEMAKGGVRASRADQVCQALGSSSRVTGWVGEVAEIESNSDGKGVLEIRLADDIAVATWNNALSDIGSGTLIEPNTELFNTVSAMSEGDLVTFSGQFFADDVDCVSEQSMTLNGSLRDPVYTMRFSSVSAYTP